jgi:hypothetical protein
LETAVRKGRHRRFEEARELKRGPDIDIEAIFKEPTGDDDEFDRTVSGRAGWFEDET